MLKDKFTLADSSKGYFTLFCPTCGYAIGDCNRTLQFRWCPVCARHNVESKLESRIVLTSPTEEVITLGEMERRTLIK